MSSRYSILLMPEPPGLSAPVSVTATGARYHPDGPGVVGETCAVAVGSCRSTLTSAPMKLVVRLGAIAGDDLQAVDACRLRSRNTN